MGYATVELIEQYKLSVVYGITGGVWYVISPFVDKNTPRISATNPVLKIAIAEVVVKLKERA